MTPPKPSYHRRSFVRRGPRALVPAAAACAALLVVRAVYLRGQPDRLFQTGSGAILTVRGGRAVLLRLDHDALWLLEQDVATGRTRTLARDAYRGAYINRSDGALDDVGYRYAVHPPLSAQQMGTIGVQVGHRDRNGLIYLGYFRADSPVTGGRLGEARKLAHFPRSKPIPPDRVRRMPLAGGPAQELRAPGAMYAWAVASVGRHLYWVVPGDDQYVRVTTPTAEWTEQTPRGRLVVSVDGGAPRALCGTVPSNALLHACGDLVWWTDNRAYPNPGRDLYLMRDGMARPVVVPYWRCLGAPVALAGRLYWIDSPAENPTAQLLSREPAALWSVRGDGADRRFELTLDRPDSTPQSLYLDRGRIFVVLAHHAPAQPAADPGYFAAPKPDATWVMRLRAAASARLDRAAVLPADASVCALDGGFVYFTLAERQGSRLSLFGEHAPPQSTTWLCREHLRE